jgi:DNA-directed RNA polymerase specialized sigma24 family protein
VDNPEDWLTQRIRRWSRPAFAWEASLPDALSLVERVREDRDAFRGRAAEWEALRVATSTLSLRESALVEAVLVRRQAIEEVADAMGISAETATRSLRRAVDKLREQEG